MSEYDIAAAFEEIEAELIASMARNFRGHRDWELDEGFNWPMWQAEQLKALERYRKEARKAMGRHSAKTDGLIDRLLETTFQDAAAEQERKILQAIRKGAHVHRKPRAGEDPDAFFRTNARKLDALREAVKNDLHTAETATLRMAEDIYRKTIFNAQVYANTGAGTLWQAVDMATKSFLAAGLGTVRYRDGRQVNAASYAEMAIRTANKRAYLTGEGAKRQEWGVSLVIVTRRETGCPYCVQWQGKVYVDDVWSGGRPDGQHPLLSTAIAGGLYHPNCKDSHTTYFPGVSTEPTPLTAEQRQKMIDNYNLQQKQRYYERQVRKYKRLETGSLDPDNTGKYGARRREWQARTRELVKENPDVLRREYAREQVRVAGVRKHPAEKVVEKIGTSAILDEKDVYAINQYKSAKSYQINSALRGEMPVTSEIEAIVSDIDQALEKLPVYMGITRRSISSDMIADLEGFHKKYTPGAVVEELSFTSSSTDSYDPSMDIQMVIKSKTGRDMRAYNSLEQEVLFKRGTKFKVVKRDGNTFYLEEES